jgi:hypothetical protein
VLVCACASCSSSGNSVAAPHWSRRGGESSTTLSVSFRVTAFVPLVVRVWSEGANKNLPKGGVLVGSLVYCSASGGSQSWPDPCQSTWLLQVWGRDKVVVAMSLMASMAS